MDNLFSERYGYVKPSEKLVVGCMPQEVINALCNCLYLLKDKINYQYDDIKKLCWTDFFNEKLSMYDKYNDCITRCLDDKKVEWNQKLDLIDFVVEILHITYYEEATSQFIDDINYEFKRLHYGYRIINYRVTPITENGEIECIEEAIDNAEDNIKEHLNRALMHLSDRQAPDYRNSIKESITAVGALCREMTGEKNLGKALNALDKKQGIHPQLKSAFGMLYGYVNDKQSGIRHELMDPQGTYVPTFYEAKFMLVTCTAFLNYMRGKFL